MSLVTCSIINFTNIAPLMVEGIKSFFIFNTRFIENMRSAPQMITWIYYQVVTLMEDICVVDLQFWGKTNQHPVLQFKELIQCVDDTNIFIEVTIWLQIQVIIWGTLYILSVRRALKVKNDSSTSTFKDTILMKFKTEHARLIGIKNSLSLKKFYKLSSSISNSNC